MKTIDEQIANAHKRLGKVAKESYVVRYQQWAHPTIHPECPIQPGEWSVSVAGVSKVSDFEVLNGPKLAPLLKQAVALCRKEFK